MIVCLTPNPALDVTYAFDELRIGHSHRVPSPAVRAGGKGVNVARVAHAQGFGVRAIVTLGGTSGETYSRELEASGLDHRIIPISRPTRQSIALVTGGQATVLNEFGDPLGPGEIDDLLEVFSRETRSADVATISGSLPPEAPKGFLTSLIRAAGDRPCIVDTSGPALLEAARAGAEVLKPNDEELKDATGLDDPLQGARALIDLGARIVFASLGEDGMLAVTGSSVLHGRLPTVLTGNPTGAGDAAVAGIATSIAEAGSLDDLDLAGALRRAVAWSAAAVLMPVAGEISDDHESFFTQVLISEG